MDWTRLINPIAIVRWIIKQFDVRRREKRVAAREQDVARREKQLEELIELRKHNIEKLPDLISLEVSSVSYSLGDMTKIIEIQFLIRNFSIFDVTLHKFSARPSCEGPKLAPISDVEEHKIMKQSASSFIITYNLPEPTAKHIIAKTDERRSVYWQFEMHGYFHSEVREFEKEQSASLHTYP